MPYIITQHAKERYAERVKGIKHPGAIREYTEKHGEDIRQGIQTLLDESELLYHGPDLASNPREVYLNDVWLVLIDTKKNCVITIYRIDFGVGEDFDREFIKRYKKKLSEALEKLTIAETEAAKDTDRYRELIAENNQQIKQLNTLCTQLEEQNNAYNALISSLNAKLGLAQQEIKTILKELLGKRVF